MELIMLRKRIVYFYRYVKEEVSIYVDTALFQLEWRSTDLCMGVVLSFNF